LMRLGRLLRRISKRKVLALTGDLAIFTPFAILPPREESGGLFLGLDDRGREVYINPVSLPSMHGILLGTTGSGKSTTARHLILEASRLGAKTWVMDPHGEAGYRRIIGSIGGVAFDLVGGGLDFLHQVGWEDRDYVLQLAKNIVYSLGLYSDFENILKEVLQKCLEKHSLEPFKAVSRLNPNLNRVFEELSRLYGGGDWGIEYLAERSVYFYFSRKVSREYAKLSFLVLLSLLDGYMRSRGDRHAFEHMVVLEEVNWLAGSDLLLSLFQETRKFGYTVLAVNQVPEQLLRGSMGLDTTLFQQAGFSILLSGPKPYVDVLGTLYGLTESEREHLLYGVRGNALLIRQGDPRPRKIRIRPHSQAL